MGLVLNILRLSLVGSSQGPSVFEIAYILTADETVRRIRKAIQQIN